MKKIRCRDKRKILFPLILTAIPVIVYLLKINGGYLAGSKVDWLSQHSVFPEYFRQRFYETGNLFPDFSMELGGGQNIYNFAYYGLYNPLYLLSYLLPFIEMTDYLQILAVLEQMADGILCYVWLKGNQFKEEESFFASIAVVLAGPVIYHSSMQFMFVSYLPFLFLALIGYDRYCRTGKYAFVTLGVLGMVLNNFYFALGGVAALVLYGLCGWKKEWASSPAVLIKSLWHQFYPAFFGGLLSFFYLVPTCCAMLAGRSEGGSVSWKELFLPEIELDKILYHPYGMGLTAAAVIVIAISLFYRRSREKYMAVSLTVLLLFPVFDWILNGTLYLREKAFIPFLPLVSYLTASFLVRFKKGVIAPRKLAAGFGAAAIFLIIGVQYVRSSKYDTYEIYVLLLDMILMGAVLLAGWKIWKRAVCTGILLTMCCSCFLQISLTKKELVTEAWMEEYESDDVTEAVKKVLEKEDGLYRTETRGTAEQNKAADNDILVPGQNVTSCYSSVTNPDYKAFREEELQLSRPTRNLLMQELSNNPLFLKIMGVRYLIVREGSGAEAPEGYQLIDTINGTCIYENEDALPVGYVTDQVISEEDFHNLSWQEKQMALQNCAVAGEGSEDTDAKEMAGTMREADLTGFQDSFHIQSDKTEKLTLPLTEREKNDSLLFISFDVKNNRRSSDVSVTVQGEKNKLTAKSAVYYNGNTTFCYTCSLTEETDSLEIELGKGDYEISDIRAWYASPKEEDTVWWKDAGLQLQKDSDSLKGSFHTEKDGWLITSIPYDENFEIRIDGKETTVQKVNEGFTGAKVTAGQHEIELIYHAPGKRAGAAVTAAAALLLLLDRLLKRKRGT